MYLKPLLEQKNKIPENAIAEVKMRSTDIQSSITCCVVIAC